MRTWFTWFSEVDGDAVRSIVSATALGCLLSVVSASALNHGHLVVPSSALFVVSTATFLRNSACRGVVPASSNGHLEKKSWIKILKEINVGRLDEDTGDKERKR